MRIWKPIYIAVSVVNFMQIVIKLWQVQHVEITVMVVGLLLLFQCAVSLFYIALREVKP